MADRGEHRMTGYRPGEGMKNLLPDKGPSASQALTVATLFPLGGFLLTLSGLALTASVIGLLLATPVFLLFSPLLVPAALLMALAMTGFLTSSALGLGGLLTLMCLANIMRGLFQRTPNYMEQAKRRMAEVAAQAGQKVKDAGEMIQSKAQPATGRT